MTSPVIDVIGMSITFAIPWASFASTVAEWHYLVGGFAGGVVVEHYAHRRRGGCSE